MKFLKGIGIIVGLMFGAGIFALPFAIARAGIFWGLVHFFIAVFLTVFLLFLYVKITYYTKGTHRFTGYVELVLGKKFKNFAFIVTMAAYYGSLLAYGVLAGLFLSNFFGGSYSFVFSILFFFVCSALVFLKLSKIALINFYLTVPLFGFVLYLLYSSFPFVDLNNFISSGKNMFLNSSWFLPYGIWLFSLGGFAAIPETKDIFAASPLRDFKKVVLISVFSSALFYCLFIFAIVGVSGVNTSPDALSGAFEILGPLIILTGSIMGLLAVFTSFLALAVDLRGIFHYDFGFSGKMSWLFTIIPPVFLFFLGAQDLTRILGLVGSVGLGVGGVLIILMFRRKFRKNKFQLLVTVAILIAVVYEIWNLFF